MGSDSDEREQGEEALPPLPDAGAEAGSGAVASEASPPSVRSSFAADDSGEADGIDDDGSGGRPLPDTMGLDDSPPGGDALPPLPEADDLEQAPSPSAAEPVLSIAPAVAAERPKDPFLGRSFGGYRLTEPIGRGGMGMVYKASQVSLDRVVAVKLLNKALVDNEEFIKRFQREARAMAQIHHPNIVAVIDFGEHQGVWYMVAEYVEGTNLARKIREQLMVPSEELTPIMVHCLMGLGHVSKSGVVHRDIKPDNILIDKNGVAKIADFGLAKDLTKDETELTAAGSAMGTPAYMSPEQCMGQKLDVRSDIYALGVTAYYALTGEKPFTGHSSFEIMTKQREHNPPEPSKINPQVPSEISALVMKMIAKKSAERFATADACREAWLSVGQKLGYFSSITRSGEYLFPTEGDAILRDALPAQPSVKYPDHQPPPPPELPDFGHAGEPSGHGTEAIALPDMHVEGAPGSEAFPKLPSGDSEIHRRPTSNVTRPPSAVQGRGTTDEHRPGSGAHERRSSERMSSGGDHVICKRCGELNHAGAAACRKCGTAFGDAPKDGGKTSSRMAPAGGAQDVQEAERLFKQGRYRESALLFARLAEQESDRRQRSVLRTKERDARSKHEDQLVRETIERLKLFEQRRDFPGAIKMLERAISESPYGGVTERLQGELERVQKAKRSRRRFKLLLVVLVVLAGAGAAGWFYRDELRVRLEALGIIPAATGAQNPEAGR